MAIRSMLDAPVVKGTGVKKENFWKSALDAADKAATSFLEGGSKALSLPGKLMDLPIGIPGVAEGPSPSQIGGAVVGAAGGLIGGAIGTAGAMLTGKKPGAEAASLISKTAKDTAQFGQMIGAEGVREAPLAFAAELAASGKAAEALNKTKTVRSKIQEKKNLDSVTELGRDVLTKREAISAIKPKVVDGKVTPTVEPQTALKAAKLKPTKQEVERGKVLLEVLDGKPPKNASEALPKIKESIGVKAKEVRTGMENIDYEPAELRSIIQDIPKPKGVKTDVPEKTWDHIKNMFLEDLSPSNNKPTVYGTSSATTRTKAPLSETLDVRQSFDQKLASEFPNLYSDPSFSPFKKAILDLRAKVRDFQASKLEAALGKEGAVRFRKSLNDQHMLYEAEDAIASKVLSGKKGAGLRSGEFKTGKVQEKVGDIYKKYQKAALITSAAAVAGAGVKSILD
jgi:hypothetical protein